MRTHANVILIVDDSESDTELLKCSLQKAGLTNPIRALRTGAEAISYLSGQPPFDDRAAHPLPCVLFIDLKLTDMSGLTVLRWASSQPSMRRILAIVHSGHTSNQDLKALYESGANSFLRKSSDPTELRNLVDYYKPYFDERVRPRFDLSGQAGEG